MRPVATLASAALSAVAIALLLCAPTPARASTEDCVQCKHVDCIKGNLRRKKAMADGYDALAKKWDRIWTKDGQPLAEVDLRANENQAEINETYGVLAGNQRVFLREEEALSDSVGPAEGCDYAEGLSADTNIETCVINGLPAAMAGSPCKQLGDLLARHEGMHQAECQARKRKGAPIPLGDPVTGTIVRTMVPVQLSPAGKARSEARAYRMEVAELEKLLRKAKAKCQLSFNGVTTSCRIPTPAGVAEMGQDIAGKVCGDPLTASWTINTVSWVRAPYVGLRRNIDPPWQNDCVAKGSTEEARRMRIFTTGPGAGWMCVYDDSTPPKIIIRNFRLKQCSPNTEQTFTVETARRECEGSKPAPPQPPPDSNLPVG
jgi:hypothetical protein